MDPLMQTLIQYLRDLQLTPGVTYEEVKKRYKQLVVIIHPDQHSQNRTAHQIAEAELKRVNVAFDFITTYRELLVNLAYYAAAAGARAGAPPPDSPPHTGGGRAAPDQPTPPAPPTSPGATTRTQLAAARTWRDRHRAPFMAAAAVIVLLGAIVIAIALDTHARREAALRLAEQLEAARLKPPPPPPTPKPSIWEPVMRDHQLPIEEIAALVGTSARAVQAAYARADYREVDINLDGKTELLITGIEGTCRKEGCPVYLIQKKAGRLFDRLPNNYGWTSVSVESHQTNGGLDIIVTASNWEEAQRTETTPAARECWRLIWSRRGNRYVYSDTAPPQDVCFEAEKSAWNVPLSRTINTWGR